ncbi:hypothetical protein [Mixta theicola]|uniref:hypothetical protein n=1 Tax=Mixta theicola TaxID=1458355 RepID=UPI0010572145|nr:hypothetical protein [Mixta theicola]GLR10650.1 hypothetical protein GCM10007905_33700 [Mixta theicola]
MGRVNVAVGKSTVKTRLAAVNPLKQMEKATVQVKGLGNVNEFLSSQSANISRKLGAKIGQGRLPYSASKAGVEHAKKP